jgi:hypothetical protein
MTNSSPATLEFDKLMKTAGQIVHEKNWDASAVISLATSLAVQVNSLTSLSGPQKKQLVLDVVKAKIHETVKTSIDLSGSPVVQSAVLDYLVENALPVFLDTLIAVSRGKIDLKKVVPKSWASCFSCFPCLSVASVQVASSPVSVQVVPVLSSQTPAVLDVKVDEIPLQSNPLYKKSDPVVPEEKSLPVVKEEEKVPVDTEIPQQQSTDTVTEVLGAVEVSPSTLPEKL